MAHTDNTPLTSKETAEAKALGFLWNKNTPDCFNARIITRNGKITGEECEAIARAAKLYGNGEIAFTTRLTCEIQGVPYNKIAPLTAYLAQYGLETGGTGAKVRPVVSCKGTTCRFGLIDTYSLALDIHNRFYAGYGTVRLPHKFKIAVGGCPNNCVKPDLNDVGVIGQRPARPDSGKCRSCKKCVVETSCPMQAAKIHADKIQINEESCNLCGRCAEACPFGAIQSGGEGFAVYIGGRWGKKFARGKRLSPTFTNRGEVLDVIESAILLFKRDGKNGERFADTIERIGFENAEKIILSGELLSSKDEIINGCD